MKPVRSTREFDPTICFTCFAPWVETIRLMAVEDPQKAVEAFLRLSDYCLYGIEPDPETNPWGFMWPSVEGEAKRSINNRRRGFGAEDVELSDAIREYAVKHPGASQRAIAEAVGCSLGKVNKALRSLCAPPAGPPDSGSGSSVHSNNSNDTNTPFPPVVNKNECEVFGFPLPSTEAREGAAL